MSKFEIVRLNDSNIKFLSTLYENVYGNKKTENHYVLKYRSITGKQNKIGFFAFDNNVPVAFFGLIPTFLSMSGRIILAAQAVDAITHPNYRKKGLFKELASRAFELAIEENIHFVFGFPNQNSTPSLINKLDFVHIHTLNRYTKNLPDSFLKKIMRKGMINIRNEDLIKNSLLQEGHDGVLYDEMYYKYKQYNKSYVINYNSHQIWHNDSKDLKIGALSTNNHFNLPELFNFFQKKLKPTSLTYMVSPGTTVDFQFAPFFKVEEGFPVVIKNISGIYTFEKLKFQLADIDIF